MGNREPGEEIRTDITWAPSVLAQVVDACENNGLDAVADQLRGYLYPPKDVALVLDTLQRAHDNVGPYRDLAELLLAGLEDLGWRRSDKISKMVTGTLAKMRDLPWSGDHLYGDALEDAATILTEVVAGRGWSGVLERFRCPSLFKPADRLRDPVRCTRQLPHEGNHWDADAQGKGQYVWADGDSLNPPQPVVEVPQMAVQRAVCSEERGGLRCHLDNNHLGEHRNGQVTWQTPGCPSRLSLDPLIRCQKPVNHAFKHGHNDGHANRVWTDNEAV